MTEKDDKLAAERERYAAMVAAGDARVQQAFAEVPREAFLTDPPWTVFLPGFGGALVTSDPHELYCDGLVALCSDTGINNGQPSLHAGWMAALNIAAGETVCQIGAGTGYYTAILARLIGPEGMVHGWEIETGLARIASANLAGYPNVRIYARDAGSEALPDCDVIYVNAALRIMEAGWLNALRQGGRMVCPWRPVPELAPTVLLTRRGNGFAVRMLPDTHFIPLAGLHAGDQLERTPDPMTLHAIRSLWLRVYYPPDDTAIAIDADSWFSRRHVDDPPVSVPPQG